METHTLVDVSRHLKRSVALNFPQPLWLRAEVAQLSESSGHIYMDLVEKEAGDGSVLARMTAILWNRRWRSLRRKEGKALDQALQEGNELRIKAELVAHERYGIQLIVREVDANHTLGQLRLQREATLGRLAAAGLLDKNAGRPLPQALRRIAVISSANAAGLQDYLSQIEENPQGYAFRQTLLPASMQGLRAAKEIAAQLTQVKAGAHDLVVIIRGGGARLDLSAFDDYHLAEAIAQCPLPVVTGIGHDVDATVADRAAHTALKTPTAVAEFVIRHNQSFEGRLRKLAAAIAQKAWEGVQGQRQQLQKQALELASLAQRQCRQGQRDLDVKAQSLQWLGRQAISQSQQKLQRLEMALRSHDPEWLKAAGYARLFDKNGMPLDSVELLSENDHFHIMARGGSVLAVAQSIKREDDKES